MFHKSMEDGKGIGIEKNEVLFQRDGKRFQRLMLLRQALDSAHAEVSLY